MRMPRASPGTRYAIERVLGRGGMSTVYLARDTVTGRRVALKMLTDHIRNDPGQGARFRREARIAAGLDHPNIVRVYEVAHDDHEISIVMEYVAGETLAEAVAGGGRLAPERAVEIGTDVCAALEHAHAAGLVHRDVTPHNILLAHDGTAKLADFGIARPVRGTTLTEHGSVLGTAAYLAPEQARGEPVSAAADIYALGAVLYECLAARPPHQADSLPALLLQRENSAAPPLRTMAPDVPPALAAVVDRCLERSPERRPRSAAELGRALREAGSHGEPRTLALPAQATTGALASEAATAVLRSPRRRRYTAVIAALATLLAGGVAAALVTSGGGPEGSAASAVMRPQPLTTVSVQRPPSPRAPVAPVAVPTAPSPAPPCGEENEVPAGRGHGRGRGHGKAKGHDKWKWNTHGDEEALEDAGRPC